MFESLTATFNQALKIGTRRALNWAWRWTSRDTLKISIQQSENETQIKLEGRIAGLWTAELGRVWVETAPQVGSRKVVLDLRDVTYADAGATKLLRDIYDQTQAEVLAGSVWTQSLADFIMHGNAQKTGQER